MNDMEEYTCAINKLNRMVELGEAGIIPQDETVAIKYAAEHLKPPIQERGHIDHELKITPQYFEAVLNGSKKFELRKDDRDFQPMDTVSLYEYDDGEYTGRAICNKLILYVLRDCSEYGLKDGYCIIGF